MDQTLKGKLVSGIIWKFLEEGAAKAVGLVVSIILARLLMPEDYAVITMITVFLTITDVFINSGLPSALIQKKDADDVDFSSVFYVNIGFSLIVYIILFFCAPLVADFYAMPILTPIMRVLSIRVLVSGVNAVQRAAVARQMIFKKFFWSTLLGTIFSAAVGIVMAYMGYGPWALVGQQLTYIVVNTLILWVIVQWRPKACFSFSKVRTLLSFGWKLLAAELFNEVYNNLRTIIIGKFYTAQDLAFYSKGREYPNTIASTINASYNTVLFSALSKVQDNVSAMRNIVKQGMKLGTYIIAPVMIGMAAICESLVLLLLTEKWIPCVPFFRIFCLEFVLMAVQTINMQVPKALGRSDITFKQELIKKTIIMVVLITTAFFGVYAIAVGSVALQIAIFVINAYPTGKYIGYSMWAQLKDVAPELVLSLIMGALVYLLRIMIAPGWILLVLQIVVGILSYLVLSIVTKNQSFCYLLGMLKKMGKKSERET